MASIVESFRSINITGRIGVITGIVASIGAFVLFVILNFFNPYVGGIARETLLTTFLGIGLPAIIGLVASFNRKTWLMYVVFISSLPLSLYLAGTPGIFRFFLLFSLGYLISAILLSIHEKRIKKELKI